MSYEESFLSTCDAEGQAPSWALIQIFDEHGADIEPFMTSTVEALWHDGETILSWLGY